MMPLSRDEITAQFAIEQPPAGSVHPLWRCLHCQNYRKAHNITRARGHLHRCDGYRAHLRSLGISHSQPRPSVIEQLRQQALPQTTETLDILATEALVKLGLPLNLFEREPMKKFLHALRPSYKPPTYEAVVEAHLPSLYDHMREGIMTKIIEPSQHINVIFDGSDDMAGHRQINISLGTEAGPAVYWKTINSGSIKHTAEQMKTIVKDELRELLGDASWHRVNAFVTDTCNSAIATANLLTTDLDLSHTFSAFCDSHGLQLLIKDILSIPTLSRSFNQATKIISFFRKSTLQLARVRDFQRLEYNGQEYALIGACATRWGTQFAALNSLRRSSHALMRWAADALQRIQNNEFRGQDIETLTQYATAAQDRHFWTEIDRLIDILGPISQAQHISEADRAHLGHVVPRWNFIRQQWNGLVHRWPDMPWSDLYQRFDCRMERQVTPINWLAFALDPKHRNSYIPPKNQEQIFSQLTQLSVKSDPAWQAMLVEEFWDFRTRSGIYSGNHIIVPAGLDLKPEPFWKLHTGLGSKLAPVAIRIFACIANTVPSERSFSAMNFIKNNRRSRLQSEIMDRCLFIYMNDRLLSESSNHLLLEAPAEEELEDIVLLAGGLEIADVAEN